MARKQRQKSETGIYHVMLRGINRQDIFLDRDDFEYMIDSFIEAKMERDNDGKVISSDNCIYYAYCILNNHVHLLEQEKALTISEIMKRIENRFVYIYNRKHERIGHLFQDRFASEPVNDIEYFHQLIRYIHRNPVKAMEAETPIDYEYSSWREYVEHTKSADMWVRGKYVCNVNAVIKRFGYKELLEWVNEDVDDECMDMDDFSRPMKDCEAWELLSEISGMSSVEDFKQLDVKTQLYYIDLVLKEGVSLRQASRLSSISYATIRRKLDRGV